MQHDDGKGLTTETPAINIMSNEDLGSHILAYSNLNPSEGDDRLEKRFASESMVLFEDLKGVWFDLRLAMAWCDAAIRMPIPDGPRVQDLELEIAPRLGLQQALLIGYRRCFTSGVRTRYPQDLLERVLDSFDGEPHALHDWVLASADKYAAHSVSPAEQIVGGVFVHPDSGGVEGVHWSSTRLVISDGQLMNIGTLAERLWVALNERVNELRDAVKAEVEALSPEDRLGLPEAAVAVADQRSAAPTSRPGARSEQRMGRPGT